MPKVKTILIIFHDLGIGGIQTRIVDILDYLNQKKSPRYKTLLYLKDVSHNRNNPLCLQAVKDSGAQIIYRPSWASGTFGVGTFFHLFLICIRYRPDTILTFLHELSLAVVLVSKFLICCKPKIVVNQGILTSLFLEDKLKNTSKLIWNNLISWSYSAADQIIVSTQAVKRDLIKDFKIRSGRIAVCHHWTLLSSRKRKKTFDLIYAGRLEPQKNLFTLLKIVKKLKNSYPKLKICLVGNGSLRKELVRFCQASHLEKNVTFTGSTTEVAKYLSLSKIFVLTSDYEGMPVSLLEAKAVGLPAVVLNFLGSQETVKDRVDGFICNNQRQFTNKVSLLLQNKALYQQISLQAQERAKTRYGKHNLQKFCSLLIN